MGILKFVFALDGQHVIKRIMRRSIRNFNIPRGKKVPRLAYKSSSIIFTSAKR